MNSLNETSAELLGAHVGDGSLYKTKTSLVWELRGGLDEKSYYTEHMDFLMKKLFNLEVKSKFRNDGKNGVWGIQTSKKEITKFLLEFGFKPGTKTYTVSVPEYIYNSNMKIKRAFVRGLFDTDGCISFDRINGGNKRTYPKIQFSFASYKLITSLKDLLKTIGFESTIWKSGDNCYSLRLAGKTKVLKWFKEIKPNNPKHLKKYFFWFNKGFYQDIPAEVA